jgi:hypothetical protein
MHLLDLPAGSAIRLTATARPDAGVHRWAVRIFAASGPAGDSAARLAYGSQIGGHDCEQRIDVPAQDADCRLEASSRHPVAGGWQDDQCSVDEDTPGHLALGFSNPSSPIAQEGDVLLSFAFRAAAQPT